jgi:hypothetical protein
VDEEEGRVNEMARVEDPDLQEELDALELIRARLLLAEKKSGELGAGLDG